MWQPERDMFWLNRLLDQLHQMRAHMVNIHLTATQRRAKGRHGSLDVVSAAEEVAVNHPLEASAQWLEERGD